MCTKSYSRIPRNCILNAAELKDVRACISDITSTSKCSHWDIYFAVNVILALQIWYKDIVHAKSYCVAVNYPLIFENSKPSWILQQIQHDKALFALCISLCAKLTWVGELNPKLTHKKLLLNYPFRVCKLKLDYNAYTENHRIKIAKLAKIFKISKYWIYWIPVRERY